MKDETESHEYPGEVRGSEHKQPQEAQSRIGVSARPDIDKCRGQRMAEKGHRHKGRQSNQTGHGVQ